MKKIFILILYVAVFIWNVAVLIVVAAIGLSPFVITYIMHSGEEDVLSLMFVIFMLGGWLFLCLAAAAIFGIIQVVSEAINDIIQVVSKAFNYQIEWRLDPEL